MKNMEREHQPDGGDLTDALRVSIGALGAALAAARVRLTDEQCAEMDRMVREGIGQIALLIVFDGAQTRAELVMVQSRPPDPNAILRIDGNALGVILTGVATH